MTREEFLSKQNKYNVPGYTDEELQNYMNRAKELHHLEEGYNFIYTCPVCGHNFCNALGCDICGYYPEMFEESEDPVEKERAVKQHYTKKIAEDKNYIFRLKY